MLRNRRLGPFGWGLVLALVLPAGAPKPVPKVLHEQAPVEAHGASPRLRPCAQRGQRHFDVIVVGDEPAGVMTALELRRRLPGLAGRHRPRLALLSEAAGDQPLGGTIGRAGLAYLDRNQMPPDLLDLLPPLAPSSELYRRFLRLTGVERIAIDPARASAAFRQALDQAGITVLSQAAIRGAQREGRRLCTLDSRTHGTLGADLFVDASLGGVLAHAAGVAFQPGLGAGPLARESLSLGWIFELEGFTVEGLQQLETRLTRRLLHPRDGEARRWLRLWPEYRNDPRRLRMDLLDATGQPRVCRAFTPDSCDQRSPALAIAFHGQEHLAPGLRRGSARLDAANVAVLPGRLSVNALLLRNDAQQNRAVLAGGDRPLSWMRPIAGEVERFFRDNGATAVRWMPELYVRSADQIAHPVEVLSATRMLEGGVPREEALGTFTYALDYRGGLAEDLATLRPTFNFGYRHTLPAELDNLAVLGPAGGFGGLGVGAGRIIELNISVGQGLAIASALALARQRPLAALNPREVAALMPPGYRPYGRPADATLLDQILARVLYVLDPWIRWGEGFIWRPAGRH
ncbi:MAG: hypothetical protein ER33_10330 [Cyanobium sp. CACIAM 14]|nr:MAG: hypothetical protein ER33_10330 [Cyanobium sp. CACIAM 14]